MENKIHPDRSSLDRRIYTVSDLTTSIKSVLESEFPFIWISGEVSNFRKPSSGHYYFTLKDEQAQIASVMFRNQNRGISFDLEDGLHILGLGRLSVYEPRGTYQIILEYIEPKGIGALQLAFEQLRDRLKKEGLFDKDHKKNIPFLPAKISLVTSPTGAVIHDLLTILHRRYPGLAVEIFPVRVQGPEAASEIVNALKWLNMRMASDVIILARGGGSLEDLQAFNSEEVARTLYASQIPVISAVGHETDFTIADFVADLRAPTPSAAAELAVPLKSELKNRVSILESRLGRIMNNQLRESRGRVNQLANRLPKPRKTLQDLMLKVDDLHHRNLLSITRMLQMHRSKLRLRSDALKSNNPAHSGIKLKFKVEQLFNNLTIILINKKNDYRHQVSRLQEKLATLNPLAVLQRGYSITRTLPQGQVLRDAGEAKLDQQLEILLARGRIIGRVERKIPHGEEKF